MADCLTEITEIRFLVEPEETRCYVYVSVLNLLECPHVVIGWHYKNFPATVSTLEILTAYLGDHLSWEHKRPPQDTRPDPVLDRPVYSRPECIFNYCPFMELCQASDSCSSPNRSQRQPDIT